MIGRRPAVPLGRSRSGLAVLIGLVLILFSGAVLAGLLQTIMLTSQRTDRRLAMTQLNAAQVAVLQQLHSQPALESGNQRHFEFAIPGGTERVTVDVTVVDSADPSLQRVRISAVLRDGSQQICEQQRTESLTSQQEAQP